VSRLTLIGGGARSGKTAFALARARSMGSRRVFIATAQALDDEMRARIARHAEERRGEFSTIEEPLDLCGALARVRDADVAVVDCLTLWLSNLVLRGDGQDRIAQQVEDLGNAIAQAPFLVVVVTNEVGLGLVPETALGRLFRDVVGRAHQHLAARAEEVYFAVLGCIVRLHPSPVAVEARS
jgi:adenosylcobinamide kinase/adenosylcobinamide-phosphate guanylyltransferase